LRGFAAQKAYMGVHFKLSAYVASSELKRCSSVLFGSTAAYYAKETEVYENELAACRKVRDYLQASLTKVNRQILDLERKSSENVSPKARPGNDSGLSVHPAVEHPDQGKPAAQRRTRNRRGAK